MIKTILYNILAALLILFLTGTGCGPNKKTVETAKEPSDNEEKGKKESSVKKDEGTGKDYPSVTVKKEGWEKAAYDDRNIKEASLSNHTLRFIVSYSGGCIDHDFDLFTKKQYTKTNPPGVSLYLAHDANGDKCKMMVTDTLHFDVKNIQYGGSGKLNLNIDGLTKPVVYEY